MRRMARVKKFSFVNKDTLRGVRGNAVADLKRDNGHVVFEAKIADNLEETLFKGDPTEVLQEALEAAENAFYDVLEKKYRW